MLLVKDMQNNEFPPVELADEHGLLAVGGNLEPDTLLKAYSSGIFPWPISEDFPIAWFAPNPRGIIFTNDLHISKSMIKIIRQQKFKIKFNNNFEQVIKLCASSRNRRDQTGTWITEEMIDAYINLFKRKQAFSVESYFENNLVGGMYGVCFGEYFSGESMFYLKNNASKFALIHLLLLLKNKKINWLDTQMVTPVVESIGAQEINRKRFMQLLSKTNFNRTSIF